MISDEEKLKEIKDYVKGREKAMTNPMLNTEELLWVVDLAERYFEVRDDAVILREENKRLHKESGLPE